MIAPATSGRAWERRHCPVCGDGHPRDARHRSLAVGSRGKYICHRCGLQGHINAQATPPQIARGQSGADDTRLRIAAACTLWADAGSLLRDEAFEARSYLASRGLNAEAIHSIDTASVYRWPSPRVGPTIAFAFRNQRGDVVAIQGRAVMPNVSCPHPALGVKKLGVFTTASTFDTRPLAIVEAPLDALSLRVCALDAIATGGTTYPAWLPGALRTSRRIVIATDADDAGQCFARNLRDALLRAGIEPRRIVRLRPGRKDMNAELVADPVRFRAEVCRVIGDLE